VALGLIPLIAVGLIGPTGLALIAAMLVLWVVGLKVPAARRMWASQPAVWAGRSVVAGITLVATVMLVRDIVEVL